MVALDIDNNLYRYLQNNIELEDFTPRYIYVIPVNCAKQQCANTIWMEDIVSDRSQCLSWTFYLFISNIWHENTFNVVWYCVSSKFWWHFFRRFFILNISLYCIFSFSGGNCLWIHLLRSKKFYPNFRLQNWNWRYFRWNISD